MMVAICDDDINIRNLIGDYVTSYYSQRNIEINLRQISSANELLNEPFNYSILFLDIMLENGIDGIDIGIKLRKMGNKALFIIVTARTDKYINAYEATVFRYIVKPLSQASVDKALSAAIEYLGTANRTFAIAYKNRTDLVNISDIILIESYMRKRYVYTNNHKYELTKPMADIIDQLKHERCFYRLQTAFLINFDHVKSNTKTFVLMVNGHKINIQRGHYEEFQISFNNYLASRLI